MNVNWEETFLSTYGTPELTLVRGEGSRVWDTAGREYIDLLGGIAVNILGAAHPKYVQAVSDQVGTLVHTSNLYINEPSVKLANKLQDLVGWPGAKVFFCNSGAEANEAALKLSRLTGKTEVVVVEGSFHGRTMGSLSLTAQPAKQEPFEPLLNDVTVVAINDLEALRTAITSATAAVFLEVIQGEAGVRALSSEFIGSAREWTSEVGALLIIDEVQTGVGRTGEWWAHAESGVTPDAITVAKSLAGGLPIGALITGGEASKLFTPGSHGSTFGGNPVSCAAAICVIEVIEEEGLLIRGATLGEELKESLVSRSHRVVAQVRGRGLLLAAELNIEGEGDPAPKFVTKALEHGLLLNAVTPTAVRLAPALTITDVEVEQALRRWEQTCGYFCEVPS
ncbi:MAG: acetylornithine transaminase [Candidatus Nanopelagicales bacterium]|jgi:acetylornithine aminotransferase|nr:acetylornithine transaminase [Candidatus Nanopelagicales bacterium]